MSDPVVVIGAGMGGLAASLALAQKGIEVLVLEARARAGGLAEGLELEGLRFDAGPYILLDRPGLEWAFEALDLELASSLELRKIESVYQVAFEGEPIGFDADLEATAARFDHRWPGSGARYTRFVEQSGALRAKLEPMLRRSRPGLFDLIGSGAITGAPFLLRSLKAVLEAAELPRPLIEAIAIWTRVAGQRLEEAPSPLAFVPALIHGPGAYLPAAGIGAIPRTIFAAAEKAGVRFRFGTKVRSITTQGRRATGVITQDDEHISARAVLSNHNGVGTYLDLAREATPEKVQANLQLLPLQSPGVICYLAATRPPVPPYLRFHLTPEVCRCLVSPGSIVPELENNGRFPARLLSPMDHGLAEAGGEAAQRDHLRGLLDDPFWREATGEAKILATRVPDQWGAEYRLYRNSMNPVMTARFMRAGRLAHRSPHLEGLYLAGSATHPGQWVSFCAISGVLAAGCVAEDLGCS